MQPRCKIGPSMPQNKSIKLSVPKWSLTLKSRQLVVERPFLIPPSDKTTISIDLDDRPCQVHEKIVRCFVEFSIICQDHLDQYFIAYFLFMDSFFQLSAYILVVSVGQHSLVKTSTNHPPRLLLPTVLWCTVLCAFWATCVWHANRVTRPH